VRDQARIEWLFDAIRAHRENDGNLPRRICEASVAALAVDGASLSLMVDGGDREEVGSSGSSAGPLAELEITVGEGPGLEAFNSGRPVLVADIDGEDKGYWPAFADGIAALGTRAVFAFPLQLGAVRFGVFTLSRRSPGPLSAHILGQALRASDVTALLLLGTDGQLAEDFDADWLDDATWTRELHQATGMVMSKLGVGVEEAFVRLRAFAFAHGMPLSEAAKQVVARRLEFPRED
jgi:ANTAR domain